MRAPGLFSLNLTRPDFGAKAAKTPKPPRTEKTGFAGISWHGFSTHEVRYSAPIDGMPSIQAIA